MALDESIELRPWLLRGAVVLVVLGAAAYGIFTWQGNRQRSQRVDQLVREARDHREFDQDYFAARSKLDEAMALDAESWEARFELGRVFLALQKPTEAVQVLESSVERAPSNRRAEVSVYLGRACQRMLIGTGKQRWYSRARSAFTQARTSPEFEPLAMDGAVMLELAVRKSEGVVALERALKILEELENRYPDYEISGSKPGQPALTSMALRELIERSRENRVKEKRARKE